MAVTLSVVRGVGADPAKRVPLDRDAVRVGRNPRADLRLEDQAFDGELEVAAADGAYQVVNRMPHAVYLDGRPLRAGERRTWPIGAVLQPTERTFLTLTVGETVAVSRGWLSADAKRAAQIAILIVLGAGLFMLLHAAVTTSPADDDRADSPAALAQELTGTGQAVWRPLALTLTEAARAEATGNAGRARQKYAEARAEVGRLLAERRVDEKDPLLAKVKATVNQRLIAPASSN